MCDLKMPIFEVVNRGFVGCDNYCLDEGNHVTQVKVRDRELRFVLCDKCLAIKSRRFDLQVEKVFEFTERGESTK